MAMGAIRVLTEMFLSEATLEFPDSEIAAVTRMIQSNERAGRIPRGATENWPIVQGHGSRAKPTPKAHTKPTPKAATPSGDSSGRVIPAQSSLRTGSTGLSHEPPGSLKKYMGGKGGAPKQPTKDVPEPKADTGPSALKRLYSKARGKDPETGLPTPKSAVTKVHGGGASERPHTFNDPERQFVGQKSDDAPLFNVPGVTDQPDADDTGDEKVAAVKRGLSGALPNAPRRQPPSFPEADVWDRFAGMTGHQEPGEPAPQKQQQGRLSRLFKGRRDDNI